jgi:membrane-bound metal-dependent hydrolase YbcI (DUF457 family)
MNSNTDMLASTPFLGKVPMPLPVSHSIIGATIFVALDRNGDGDGSGSGAVWPRLLAAVALANAPDLDLVPGILLGDPNRFHHGVTHSLVTAVLVGIVAALVAAWFGASWPAWKGLGPPGVATALVVASLWGSHVMLDAVTHDPSPPAGVPMFWPLSSGRVSGPAVFARADKVDGAATPLQFAASLMSAHNARAVAREGLLTAPLLLLAWWSRRRTSRAPGRQPG